MCRCKGKGEGSKDVCCGGMMGKGMMGKKKWSDLSTGEKVGTVVMASIQLALAAAAWTDLAKRPASQVNGPKSAWALAIGVNFVGPIAYFVKGRKPEA